MEVVEFLGIGMLIILILMSLWAIGYCHKWGYKPHLHYGDPNAYDRHRASEMHYRQISMEQDMINAINHRPSTFGQELKSTGESLVDLGKELIKF